MAKGLKEQVGDLERSLIWVALRKTGGNQSGAAKKLGISERMLRYKMKKHGIRLETKLSDYDKTVDKYISYMKHGVS